MTVRPLVCLAACLAATCALSLSFADSTLAARGTSPGRATEALRFSVSPWRLGEFHHSLLAAQDQPGATSAQEPLQRDNTPVALAAPAPAVVDPPADGFRIGPEDVLDVQVWKNTELSRVVPVRPDGMISLPLVNDIRAAGLTPIQLRQQITLRLSEFVPSPEVSVIVREVHSVKVAVLGAVRMPGHYEVNSAATVLELIARAQGLTEFADRGRIVVLRQNGATTKRIPFNYRKVAEGSEQDNFFVQSGDIIVVP
ncbi:MAG: polysaccharide biosynthesis/export family protein [Vicinamibacterales bacterium]